MYHIKYFLVLLLMLLLGRKVREVKIERIEGLFFVDRKGGSEEARKRGEREKTFLN